MTRDDQIVVLAATNHIDSIHPGILRSGRIDRLIHVPLPTQQDRLEILQLLASKSLVKFSPDVDLGLISQSTDLMNGSSLSELIRRASIKAVGRNEQLPVIEMADLMNTM